MHKIFRLFAVLFFLIPGLCQAQKPSDFLPEKPGKWSYSSNIKSRGNEAVNFNKNLAVLAEWFHQNVSILTNPTGFDLKACTYGTWDDNYKQKQSSYAHRAEIDFEFQLFYSKGGKWVIEPPHFAVGINDTETAHGSNFGGYDGFKIQGDDPKLEKALSDAILKISEFFCVFELEKEIVPGIRLYKNGSLVVFNPNRPDYWIPVTVKEVIQEMMNYWKIKPGDKEVYNYFEAAYNKMSEEELNSQAYFGSDDAIIDVWGKPEGLKIMRFNPEYWNRNIPRSAIQYITMYAKEQTETEMEESYKNNGHPNYPLILPNSFNKEKLLTLIEK
ncbi:MAG: hypothetical protein WCL21_09540 [Mariniphaga sp.]